MTPLLRLLVLCVGISLVSALLHSERHFESFSPAVPQVHLLDLDQQYLRYVSTRQTADAHVIALDLAEQAIGFNVSYIVKNSYVSSHNQVRHVYLKQTADDEREIFNADLNINVHRKRALSIGHTFFNGSTSAIPSSLSSIEALNMLIAFLKIDSTGAELIPTLPSGVDLNHNIAGVRGALQPARMRAGYIQVDYGTRLEPVWDIELDMDLHWWSATVSSVDGQVLSVNDWVNDANSFEIYPIGVNDPSDGVRTVVTNPANSLASPNGWNDQTGSIFYTTIGNNVYAQSNPSGGNAFLNNPRPSGAPNNDYSFSINFADAPSMYVNGSTTNLFAWNNYIHDIFYQYGFTEEAGNFQENNLGRGGLGNDAVQANCQDGAGTNNANFATPPDGQRPRMRMYVWTLSTPNRDGDLDQGIIIHEYGHGISNRLTGGPANSNCLSSTDAGGMGEGWSDFFATVLRQRSTYTDTTPFVMGDYSANNPAGIRKFPYTTDMTVNPETFDYVNRAGYEGVHAKGEVWCGMLWEVYWNFVNNYGFDANVYTGTKGNNKILQLVVDGMKLQPCNPDFITARDAIIKADQVISLGANFCRLWAGFAKRGLGVGAKYERLLPILPGKAVQDFSVPLACR